MRPRLWSHSLETLKIYRGQDIVDQGFKLQSQSQFCHILCYCRILWIKEVNAVTIVVALPKTSKTLTLLLKLHGLF